jgi:hypothetical protein
MKATITVKDAKTGIELPNSLVTVTARDGRLLWIGWSPTTTADINPQPIHVTVVKPVGPGDITGVTPGVYIKTTYMPGIAEEITINAGRTISSAPWWYTAATQSKLNVQYNNSYASNLTVRDVQALLEGRYKVYLMKTLPPTRPSPAFIYRRWPYE